MIGLYLHRDGLRFCVRRTEEFAVYDHELNDHSPWDEAWIETAFQMAKVELDFTYRDDFRLLIDSPFAYCTAQSVPFGEKQLPQVLENYLEEELPEDIEDFQFDYRVLHSKGLHSAILGFWIKGQILKAWCHFADENALNSLDIQPAEAFLLPDVGSEPRLTLNKDLQGQIRYSCLVHNEGLPQLTLGSLPPQSSLDQVLKTLRFQGSNWSNVAELHFDNSLPEMESLHQKLGIAKGLSFEAPLKDDPFSPRAIESAELSLNFRKGDFAQKGMLERVIWPIAIVATAAIVWIGGLTYQTYKQVDKTKADIRWIQQQKVSIWKSLFPEKRVPDSRMPNAIEIEYKKMTGEDSNNDDSEEVSRLQALGLLFTHIKADDDILIERASIGKTITLSGTSTDQDRVYRLGDGFKDQIEFKEPDITASSRSKEGEAPIYQFRFSTSYEDKK